MNTFNSATMSRIAWKRFRKNRLAVIGSIIEVVILLTALMAPVISGYDPDAIVSSPLQPPSWKHPMGTDTLGKDVLSRTIWGSRITLFIGLGASLVALAVGVIVGAVSGYYGKIVDGIFMRITDVILSIPYFILCILVVATFRSPSPSIIMLTLGFLMWPRLARIIRTDFLSLKEQDYVKAAIAAGAKDTRIILRHLLPNDLAPIIITSTMNVASSILTAASLEYLGLGDVTSISWGMMMNQGRIVLRSASWLTTFPGIALFLTSLGFNLVGDGLRDALDPRLW